MSMRPAEVKKKLLPLAASAGIGALAVLAGAAGEDVPAPAWYDLPAEQEPLAGLDLAHLLVVHPVSFSVRRDAAPMTPRRPKPVKPAAGSGGVIDWRADLHSTALSLNVTAPQTGQRDLSEAAQMILNLPETTMQARLAASAGKQADEPALWHKRAASIDLHTEALPHAGVALTGANDYELIYREPAKLGDSGNKAHLIQGDTRSARLKTDIRLDDTATLELSAAGSGKTTTDSTLTGSAAAQSQIVTQNRDLAAGLRWNLLPALTVEAAARERGSAISWQAGARRDAGYRAFAPRLAADLELDGTRIDASLERSTGDYDAGAYVAYARAAEVGDTLTVEPDHAWRFATSLEHKIGDAELQAAYVASRRGTATEYGLLDSGQQVPVSTRLAQKDEINVSLSLPLDGAGLAGASLAGDAHWRDSRVLDPVTGAMRRASSEVPGALSLRFEQKLPAKRLRFGLNAELRETEQSYQARQITETSDGVSLGAFVSYRPGAYAVNLAVEGLAGNPDVTDFVYGRSRAEALQQPRIVAHPDAGPALRLTLEHKF
jgi:hypothetical protein